MECDWENALLERAQQLPSELLDVIRDQNSSHERYLEAFTHATVVHNGRHLPQLLAHCDNLFPHICAVLSSRRSCTAAIATLGRLVPFAPYLAPYAHQVLSRADFAPNLEEPDGSDDDQVAILLGLFRLLSHDHCAFTKHIRPTQIHQLLASRNRPVVYLALRILQICLKGSDSWFEEMMRQHFGPDSPDGGIHGSYDDVSIDYRFLSLWEEDRNEKMQLASTEVTAQGDVIRSKSGRMLPSSCFHHSTALLGKILLPRTQSYNGSSDSLVWTETVQSNVQHIAQAIKSSSPMLLNGLAGSGKTLLIRHVARTVGKLDDMITLHLNDQSDAKLLVGIYTTGKTPGTFVWKAGVLTTAVMEGRWVLIEDLDRAPSHIISTLLPLIEKGELLVPGRKETIRAKEGFRIISTVRTTINHRGEESRPMPNMIGARHWQNVHLSLPSTGELQQTLSTLYPSLAPLMPQFLKAFERLQSWRQSATHAGQSRTGILRPVSPRDLMKWCSRVAKLLQGKPTFASTDLDDILLEAVDCFVGALPVGPVRSDMVSVIAQELHVDPQRCDFVINTREAPYAVEKTRIKLGRHVLPRSRTSPRANETQASFSTNPITSRMLERVAAAVINREPLLLVGETGVGKTTAVQHLASHLGKKLVPFNLSQQSEAGDLLGGFKPISARSLMVPMKDEFDELFSVGFSHSKNQSFRELLGKQFAKGNWKAVCKLWQQALKMVDQQRGTSPSKQGEAPAKKRKVDSGIDFARWDSFAVNVSDVTKRLSAGSEAFAFSFVEGTIVKAVRNGDWVLLDEINLASPDTLDALADLFDSTTPSLLLTEAGEVERIEAHPEFRVFAAMNPATDVGKKDLLPSVRSRFTELYVESPDKDIKSLQSIVRAYLRQDAVADTAIAYDVSLLYQKIQSLAEENKLVDGAGQKPHFSLRTLTRTLSYAKHIAPMCSLRRALYEGFQMSFLTFLDLESETLVQPLLEQQLLSKRVNVRAELKKPLRKPSDEHDYAQGFPGSKHWIRQGAFEAEEQPQYIITPFIQRNLENLVRATSTRQFPVLIQGPTSSGKTSMVEYLAKRTGNKFVRVNNHEHTDLQEYLGTYISGSDGRLQFQEGVLVKALREGHWIVLDELNLAPTDVLEAFNRLLDDNRELLIPETQEIVRPHTNFMLFATQNPAGLYGGRKTLSRAFRNRFLELHFDDIPVDELQEILHRRTQQPESRCKRIVTVYRELSVLRQENRLFEQKSFATLRDLFRWAMRPNDTIEQLAANGFMLLAERVRKPEERAVLKNIIEKQMSARGPKVTIDEDALYSTQANEIQQYNSHASSQGVVWTKAMRRLYVLVARAIENNEPVLLVGETGCGKTTVCQMLAEAFGKELNAVNAHQNTETGDLIGSQRPVRNRAAIEAELRKLVLVSAPLQGSQTGGSVATDELLVLYDRAISSRHGPEKQAYVTSDHHALIESLRVRYKALFEWQDGSLVQAMRSGSFFLLDEISLADDSVLERINSVLEAQRSILLAEKGSLDSFITAASGFQFFATMNPGGDYGKRELSPALRNRFTEIWVPSLSDQEDIFQILQARLSPAAKSYAEAMVSFAVWFKERYNTSASSSVSIRDTLAWVAFVNAATDENIGQAVVHGAAMVYTDTLGANPAGLMTLTGRGLDEERRAAIDELSRLLQIDVATIYHDSVKVVQGQQSLIVGPFSIPCYTPVDTPDPTFSFEAPTTRLNALRVVRALQLSKPVMLEGSPGVGKTALVGAIAASVGMPLVRINLSEQTDLMDLFGSDVPVEGAETGAFRWRDAPFLHAMKTGEWVLLDEMNLASQSVLEGLNACLDHRGEVYIPEIDQSFTRHPSFRLFAAQNPHHQGGGRKGLPASFVNRFTVVYADAFRAEDMLLICQRAFPNLPVESIGKAVGFVEKLEYEVAHRRRFGSQGGPWEFNLRDIFRWLTLSSSDKGLLKAGNARDFVHLLFSRRFRSTSDRALLDQLFDSIYHDTPYATDLSCSTSPLVIQAGLGTIARNELESVPLAKKSPPSRDQLEVLQSLMLCIQQSWPVILSGPSGSGKSSLVERLAAATGAPLVVFPMNAETDAMDLVGGYEQADPGRKVLQAFNQLRRVLERHSKQRMMSSTNAEKLLLTVERAGLGTELAPRDTALLESTLALLENPEVEALWNIVKSAPKQVEKARFEWIDGVLVDALERGEWLVLDNANLCSPSVLDRLNSLLERNGALIINEHADHDGSPRVIKPHPGFRIFLTTDPRYGELSRAMRNRAVELFMPQAASQDASLLCDPLFAESAVAAFRNVKSLSQHRPSFDGRLGGMVFDHLPQAQLKLISRLQSQLDAGLYSSQQQPPLRLPLQHANIVTQLNPEILDASASILGHTQMSADYANVQVSSSAPPVSERKADGKCFFQTLHPLNNQPFVQQSQHAVTRALQAGFSFDLVWELSGLKLLLDESRANSATVSRLKGIERSVLKLAKTKSGNSALLQMLEHLLQGMLHFTQDPVALFEQSSLSSSDESSAAISQLLAALALKAVTAWKMLFETAHDDAFDGAVFNACVTTIEQGLSRAIAAAPSSNTQVTNRLQEAIAGLRNHSNTGWGLACTALWLACRPKTPKTIQQLDALLRLEAAADRFDETAAKYSAPLDKLAATRVSFQRALRLAQAGEGAVDDLLERLEGSLQTAPNLSPEAPEVDPRPHYASVFATLSARFQTQQAASRQNLSEEELSLLEMLAGKVTKTAGPSMLVLPLNGPEKAMEVGSAGSGGAFHLHEMLMRHAASTDNVSLGKLELLRSETNVLGRVLASKTHDICAEELESLDAILAQQLGDILRTLTGAEVDALSRQAAQLLVKLDPEASSGVTDLTPSEPPYQSEPLLAEALQCLAVVTNYLCSDSQNIQRQRSAAGRAWLSFGIGCLMLYVPDSVFDPSLKPRLERDLHRRSQAHLAGRLNALNAFNALTNGSASSLRSRILEGTAQQLGEEPSAVEVCRPEKSQLSQLHGELAALKRALASVIRAQNINGTGDAATWNNILNIRQRLSEYYRAYMDFTAPIVGFIDGLCTGRDLIQQAALDEETESSALALSKVVPLRNASLATWLSDDSFVYALRESRTPQQAVHCLTALAARCTLKALSKASLELRDAVNDQLSRIYQLWRSELSIDQRQASAKSSLYRYKGDADVNEDETAAEEMEELFPSYEQQSTSRQAAEAGSKKTAQSLAPTLARIHRAIFAPAEANPETLLALLQNTREACADSSLSSSIPAMIDLLQAQVSQLSPAERPERSYNIYRDANIHEATKLVNLVNTTVKRFQELHAAWPEHATPFEVLRTCEQILQLSHASPVARLLQLVEKLHGAVNEWQKVASREYSVYTILEDLTSLIISWRQLELSTWAGLFDHETSRCEEEVSSWWYVAYESIIAVLESLETSEDALCRHTAQLLETLSGLLTTSGLGEYTSRLNLLRSFRAHLESLATDRPVLGVVHSGLSNLIAYYGHFEDPAKKALEDGQAGLTKDMKSVLQVASWKDRNIETLRQSAKASHKKLLRMVRKYRNLLGQPVQPIISSGIPEMKIDKDLPSQLRVLQAEEDLARNEIQITLPAWTERSARFKNVTTTAGMIQNRATLAMEPIDASKRLDDFMSSVTSGMAELQKATPANLTAKNKAFVGHLKTRKRRLLADVLKDLRAMGFQASLSENALSRQRSLSVVLAGLSALDASRSSNHQHAAEHNFHRLLDAMPAVREVARQHSDDLTPAEISRCVSYLESMLQVSATQRSSLAVHVLAANKLDSVIDTMMAFSRSGNVCIAERSGKFTLSSTEISSLLTVVRAVLQLVEIQAKLAGSQYSAVEQGMTQWLESTAALALQLSAAPELPSGLDTDGRKSLQLQIGDRVRDLEGKVTEWSGSHPELAPLLSQLHAWVPSFTPGHSQLQATGQVSMSDNDWLQKLLITLDHMLVAVQNIKPAEEEQDSSRATWLLDQQQEASKALHQLQAMRVPRALEQLLEQLHRVKTADADNLRSLSSACSSVIPIVSAYQNAQRVVLSRLESMHSSTTTMADSLARTFIRLGNQGFCTPQEKSSSTEDQKGEAEAGTGLGEGEAEGAEDISKDVKDDEDLSELAQEPQSKKEDGEEEIKDEKDAVDMADQEMEGEMGDEGPASDDEGGGESGGSDAGDQDMEEETGDVDENGPSAVDEKMWDDGKAEDEKEREGDAGKGSAPEDDLAASREAENKEQDKQEGGEEEELEAGADESEEVGQQDSEKLDQHLQEQENLELPEDLDIEGQNDGKDDDLDLGSDEGEDENMEDATGGQDVDTSEEPANEEPDKTEQQASEEDDLQPNQDAEQDEEQEHDLENEAEEDAERNMLQGEQNEDNEGDEEDKVVGDEGQGLDKDTSEGTAAAGEAAPQADDNDTEQDNGESDAPAEGGASKTAGDNAPSADQNDSETRNKQPYQQIGDALDEWYKQHRRIEEAKEDQAQQPNADVDMADARFEHVANDEVTADTQALGAASAEQSTAIEEDQGLSVNDEMERDQMPFQEPEEEATDQDADAIPADSMDLDVADRQEDQPKAFVGQSQNQTDMQDEKMDEGSPPPEEDDVEDVDQQLLDTHISREDQPEEVSMEEARQIYGEHEANTRNLALMLTEHLRLILQPTQATKMRGDFRTGKRLNIKRIIPYIASSYKRDKIWMRRSVPSKRNYQIMLAIDDSKSMAESESQKLAFSTLALISKSMAMLEVGELSVVGFGEDMKMIHNFDSPWTSDAGAEAFKSFTFSQSKTDIIKLLRGSLEAFREARLKGTSSTSQLWQLQLIISDGMCEDHATIRQLVRQAHEEQIMIVFIVVDAAAMATQAGSKGNQSILDLQRAEFAKDPNGEQRVKMIKYMDSFPFNYYLVVRDVGELPGVLAGALRQWFAEVVDTSS
ncbi:hypothetical protein MBLNU230_g4851t1 [Neophaeotheca triangularis]